jgi:hypothetical protein
LPQLQCVRFSIVAEGSTLPHREGRALAVFQRHGRAKKNIGKLKRRYLLRNLQSCL